MENLFGEEEELKPRNRNDENHIEGLSYLPEFISEEEHKSLIKLIDNQPWMHDLKRRVQHYGYKYDYKKRKVDYSMKIADLPAWLNKFAIRLKQKNIFPEVPDQVIVNEYLPGQGISNHIDCEPCFTDTIASLSLCSNCVMNFTNAKNKKEIIPLLLDKKSLVVLKDKARYDWMHGIKMVKKDKYYGHKIIRKRRVSLTFRKVILQ